MTLSDLLQMYSSGGNPSRRVQVMGQGPGAPDYSGGPFQRPGQRVSVVGQQPDRDMYGRPMWLIRQLTNQNQPRQPAPQLAPIERHAFPVGNWGGMQAALAARGNRPMGAAQHAAQGQAQQFGGGGLGGMGGTLGAMLGMLGGGGF